MDTLIRYGFSIEEIKNIMDSNSEIEFSDEFEIDSLINLLEKNGCSNNIIKNIFLTNPFVIGKNVKDISELINKLYDIGLDNLFIIFDSNPFILNMDCKGIDSIYNRLIDEGYLKSDIINYFYFEIDKIM